MLLKSELITNKNLDEALKLQNFIFPRENAKVNFLDSIKEQTLATIPKKFRLEYFLVRNETGKAIGLWGHYLEKDKHELWLGWYGVAPEERNKGYGTEIFKIFEAYARINNFSVIRLYTDEEDNAAACRLYERFGMTKEYYNNKNDISKDIGKIIIYSKSLTGKKAKLWNSKFLNYKGQKEKENN